MFNVLLVDDEICEKELIATQLQSYTNNHYKLDHALKCSEAMHFLNANSYDLVLLDNILSQSISGQFSVPIIRSHVGVSPLVIISNCVDIDYLADPAILGVDYIVSKINLPHYLKLFYRKLCNENQNKNKSVSYRQAVL